MFSTLRGEAQDYIRSAVETVYWMRGGLTYFEYFELTYAERSIFQEFINNRLEQESKKPLSMNRVY